MGLYEIDDRHPNVPPDVYLAPGSQLVGDVSVGSDSSLWFNAVVRGDVLPVRIGERTNIQDLAMVHVTTNRFPCTIGDDVTVGHGAKFESCTIGDRTVVGMNAVILQKAAIGPECVLAANTVVLEGADIPARSVVAGVPGVIKKTLEGSAAKWIEGGGSHYVELSREYLAQGIGRPNEE